MLTAIKLLLTDPLPLVDELKCSITSQLDFFGVVVCGPVPGDGNGCTCSSSDICAERVCRNDVDRRAMPALRPPPSCGRLGGERKQNKVDADKNQIWCWNGI